MPRGAIIGTDNARATLVGRTSGAPGSAAMFGPRAIGWRVQVFRPAEVGPGASLTLA